MKRPLRWLPHLVLFVCCQAFVGAQNPAPIQLLQKPAPPIVEERCPLRDCKFGDWVTKTPVVIRKDRTENLRGVARLAAGTRVQVLQHVTVVNGSSKEWWVKVGDPKGRAGWTNQVQLFNRDPFAKPEVKDAGLDPGVTERLDKLFPGWELAPACKVDYHDVKSLPSYAEGDFDGDGIDDKVIVIVTGPGKVDRSRLQKVLVFITRDDGMNMYRAWEGYSDRAGLVVKQQLDGSDMFSVTNCASANQMFAWNKYGFTPKTVPVDAR